MQQEGFPAYGHDIGEHFAIGPVRVEVTPADHAWQNASPCASDRIFEREDACGFCIVTQDGTIWAPSDSRLIPDHHLRMPTPDAMLFDFSNSEWRFDRGQDWLAAAYCSSVPGSSQVVPSPLSVPSSMARWHIMLSAVPLCPCSSPGRVLTVSPARILISVPSRLPTSPTAGAG
jgi:Beta-lactamase superfamily domain